MKADGVLRIILIVVIALIAIKVVSFVLGALGAVFHLAINVAIIVGIVWLLVYLLGRKKSYLS